MNEYEIHEYMRCAGNIEYFAETYIKVWHPDKGLHSIELNDFQKEAIKDFKEKKFFSKAGTRISGKTFLASVLFLHESLFNDKKTNVVIAPTLQLATNMLLRINEMYNNLPQFLRMTKMTMNNKREIEFDNGSKVRTFGPDAHWMRGLSISNVYFEESELIQNLKEKFEALYPCIFSGSKIGRMFVFTSSRTSEVFKESRSVA